MKNEETKNELATLEKNHFDLVPFTAEIRDAIEEELDGMSLRFDMVKTPTAGSLAFEVPSDDPENPDIAKELIGIIVNHHKVNAFWEGEFDGANNTPICSSRDGKSGFDTQAAETVNCANCPRNQFGSDKNGRGKACKNMEHLYLLRSGNPLPIVVVIPPSSLKAWQEYLSKGVVLRGKKLNEVLTKITLKKEQNADGIQYSKFVFTKLDNLTPDEIAYVGPMAKALKDLTQNVETPIYPDTPMEADAEGKTDLPF